MEDKAAQWAITITNHVAANTGVLSPDLDTWDKLHTELKKYFGDATPEDTAILELNKLCNLDPKERDRRDVGLYVTEFQTYAVRIFSLSDKDKEIRFTQGLHFQELGSQRKPTGQLRRLDYAESSNLRRLLSCS